MSGKERVLVSTHDLPRAGDVRDGFVAAGYDTELVTPSERLTREDEVVLLVLTGVDKTCLDRAQPQRYVLAHVSDS